MDYISSNPSNSSLFFQDYNRHNTIKVIKITYKSMVLKSHMTSQQTDQSTGSHDGVDKLLN